MPEVDARFPVGLLYDRAVSDADADMRADAAHVDHRFGVAGRAFDLERARALAVDASLLVVLTVATAVVYVWTKAPLYNPFGTIDTWLYTALWTNFAQTYEAFAGTYYVSRVPWIVPGYLLNAFFDARTAFVVLHATYFLAGGVLFYVLCRRWLGVVPAAMGYVGLIGSHMYFNAHRWDYYEGGVITCMIGAYAFSLVRTDSTFARAASLVLGGAFAAAMVTTRIIDVVFLVGIPLLYAAVTADLPWRPRLLRFARDIGAFAAGAATLVLACGLFARSHGEEFLYFMPQVRVAQQTSGGYNQLPVDAWLPLSPYFWVPLFVIVFAAVVVAFGPKHDRLARRFLVGAALWLAVDYGGFAAWQFLGDGWLFNITYYFDSFLVPTFVCLTAATAVLLGAQRLDRWALLVCVASALAVLGPVVWIYRTDNGLRTATSYGDHSITVLVVVMGLALLLAVLARTPRLRGLAAAAVVAAFFAVAYGIDASYTTFSGGASDPRTGGLYDVGQKLIARMRAEGYTKTMPRFWYDASDVQSGIGSMQSLYYYAFTYMDVAMPSITDTFRSRMTVWRPDRIVLLCTQPGCGGAATAMGRAGYKPRLRSQALLESDRVHVWVMIYKVEPVG